jgi:hypothetical protein
MRRQGNRFSKKEFSLNRHGANCDKNLHYRVPTGAGISTRVILSMQDEVVPFLSDAGVRSRVF